MRRKPTIRLSYPHANPASDKDEDRLYKIEQVVGTIDYTPGQLFDRAAVKRICDVSDLAVVIVSPTTERPRTPKRSKLGTDFTGLDFARRRAGGLTDAPPDGEMVPDNPPILTDQSQR